MIIGIKLSKQFNNIIQFCIILAILLLHEKTNMQHQSQIQDNMIGLLYQKRKSQVFLFYIVSKKF